MSVGGDKPFGLNDVNLIDSGETADANLPSARILGFKLVTQNALLEGDDQVVAAASRTSHAEWDLEAGGIDLDAYAILTGYTVSSSGSTPNQQDTLDLDAAACMPWFQIHGKALGDDCTDDIHVSMYKAKVTDMDGRLANGEFFITKCSGIAIDDGSHGIVRIVQHETAAALPTAP